MNPSSTPDTSDTSAGPRQVDRLLAHYGESHQHPTNELIHFIAIPLIMLSLLGMMFALHPWVAYLFIAASMVYYLRLSLVFLGTMVLWSAILLALIVELLVTALLGAQFGFEASPFFIDEGNAPRLGQAFVVINPGALAGQDVYYERMETLITEMLVDNGVRLAGARRIALEQQAGQSGLTIPDALDEQLHRLAKMQ